MFGDKANARPINTFCWLPPLSDVILSPRSPMRIDSFSRSHSNGPESVFQSMIASFPTRDLER